MMEYQQMSSQTNDGCLTGFTEILNTTKTEITNTLLAINEC